MGVPRRDACTHWLMLCPSSPSSSLSSQGQTGSPRAPVAIGLEKEIDLIKLKTASNLEEYDVCAGLYLFVWEFRIALRDEA